MIRILFSFLLLASLSTEASIRLVRVNVGGVKNFKKSMNWYIDNLGFEIDPTEKQTLPTAQQEQQNRICFDPDKNCDQVFPWVQLRLPGQNDFAIILADGAPDANTGVDRQGRKFIRNTYGMLTIKERDLCSRIAELKGNSVRMAQPVTFARRGPNGNKRQLEASVLDLHGQEIVYYQVLDDEPINEENPCPN